MTTLTGLLLDGIASSTRAAAREGISSRYGVGRLDQAFDRLEQGAFDSSELTSILRPSDPTVGLTQLVNVFDGGGSANGFLPSDNFGMKLGESSWSYVGIPTADEAEISELSADWEQVDRQAFFDSISAARTRLYWELWPTEAGTYAFIPQLINPIPAPIERRLPFFFLALPIIERTNPVGLRAMVRGIVGPIRRRFTQPSRPPVDNSRCRLVLRDEDGNPSLRGRCREIRCTGKCKGIKTESYGEIIYLACNC